MADLVAVATFPPRLRDGQSPEELRAAAITSLYYMPYMTPETILDGFRHYNNVIRDVAANENALLVGADDTIAADGEHYTNSVHFTDAGSIQMAKRVVDALLKSDQFLSLSPSANTRRRTAAHLNRSTNDLPPECSACAWRGWWRFQHLVYLRGRRTPIMSAQDRKSPGVQSRDDIPRARSCKGRGARVCLDPAVELSSAI